MTFIHPYRHELAQFYDRHAKLARGYHDQYESWRRQVDRAIHDDDHQLGRLAWSRSIDMANKSAEHYEIADGTRHILMGEGR